MLDQQAAEALPGGVDPALLPEVAHTTAAAIVHGARALDDPDLVSRLVRLVESEGLDVVASMWADAGPHSLPGALWRLYVLRQWVRRDPATLAARYLTGITAAPVHEVVAGVASPPGPQELSDLADSVLGGVFTGDLDVALERAAAFCRVLAAGVALDADEHEAADELRAAHETRGAASLVRTAEELEHCAVLWRADRLD
ncbi:MAG: hypothetical protein M3Y20_05635 [Actinomycetota bacterium]|nr:hypothetical protein [Actinomycetota bacterium]